jgi:hypothetical protein
MSKGAEVPPATKSFLGSYNDMDKMKDIMAKRGIVNFDDSLAFLCDHGCEMMFKRMVLVVCTPSFPFDTCNIISVVSAALKAGNIDILAFLMELEGVSVDTFQSCSSEWWVDVIHKDLCLEILRDKTNYPIHVALRRLLPQEELLDFIRSHSGSVCTGDYLDTLHLMLLLHRNLLQLYYQRYCTRHVLVCWRAETNCYTADY